MIGKRLGPYEIVAYIGAGGMATVYKAYHRAIDRYVALKILPEQYARTPAFVERFRREAVVIARLEHAHILPVYDFGDDQGILYIAMRLADFGTLADRIRLGPVLLPEACRIVEQVAGALDYAHRQRVIHRDVKPSNILIDESGDAYLADFGIAKLLEEAAGLTGSATLGTPQYMSPEQCTGQPIDGRADIYALGVVLYEMVTGRAPFQGDTPYTIIQNKLNAPLNPPRTLRPDLPEPIEAVIVKALAVDPGARFWSAGEMAAALNEALKSAGPLDATLDDRQLFIPSTPITPAARQALTPTQTAPPPSPEPVALKRPASRWVGLTLLGVLTFFVLILVSILAARFIRPRSTLTPTTSATFTASPDGTGTAAAIVAEAFTATAHVTATAIAEITRDAAQTAVFDTAVAHAIEATGHAVETRLAQRALTPTARPDRVTDVVMVSDFTPTPSPSASAAVSLTGTATPTPTTAVGSGKIAFASNRNGDYDLYILMLDASGNALRQVTTGTDAEIHPAWSPDGERLAFASNRDGDWDIYITDAEGRALTKLTDSASTNRAPAWSPDGGWIAFHSNRDGDFDIYVMDTNGKRVQPVTANDNWDSSPAWSPDGAWIAYQSNRGAGYEIFVAPFGGAGCEDLPEGCAVAEHQLTKNAVDDLAPAWSPDGERIAFASDRDGDFEIYVMAADGTRVQQLTDDPADDLHPAWSPDGSQIAYYSDRDEQLEIYVLTVDAAPSRRLRRLTFNRAGDFWPAWSPEK